PPYADGGKKVYWPIFLVFFLADFFLGFFIYAYTGSIILTGLWELAAMVTAAPIWEEIVFRKWIFKDLLLNKLNLGILASIITSGLIFSVSHLIMPIMLGADSSEMPALLPQFLGGVAFAALYVKTGKLRNPVIFHSLYNLSMLLLVLFDVSLPYIALYAALGVLILLCWPNKQQQETFKQKDGGDKKSIAYFVAAFAGSMVAVYYAWVNGGFSTDATLWHTIETILGFTLIPVMEEILFRKWLFKDLLLDKLKMGAPAAILLSASVFAILHPLNQGTWFLPVSQFVAGALWAYLYLKLKSLKPGIIAHAISNFSVEIIALLAASNVFLQGLFSNELASIAVAIAIDAAVFGALLLALSKKEKTAQDGGRLKLIILGFIAGIVLYAALTCFFALSGSVIPDSLLILFLIVVIVPAGMEIVFRRLLMKEVLIKTLNLTPGLGILISSFLYTLCWSCYPVYLPRFLDPGLQLATILLGNILLGSLYAKSKKFEFPLVCHVLFMGAVFSVIGFFPDVAVVLLLALPSLLLNFPIMALIFKLYPSIEEQQAFKQSDGGAEREGNIRQLEKLFPGIDLAKAYDDMVAAVRARYENKLSSRPADYRISISDDNGKVFSMRVTGNQVKAVINGKEEEYLAVYRNKSYEKSLLLGAQDKGLLTPEIFAFFMQYMETSGVVAAEGTRAVMNADTRSASFNMDGKQVAFGNRVVAAGDLINSAVRLFGYHTHIADSAALSEGDRKCLENNCRATGRRSVEIIWSITREGILTGTIYVASVKGKAISHSVAGSLKLIVDRAMAQDILRPVVVILETVNGRRAFTFTPEYKDGGKNEAPLGLWALVLTVGLFTTLTISALIQDPAHFLNNYMSIMALGFFGLITLLLFRFIWREAWFPVPTHLKEMRRLTKKVCSTMDVLYFPEQNAFAPNPDYISYLLEFQYEAYLLRKLTANFPENDSRRQAVETAFEMIERDEFDQKTTYPRSNRDLVRIVRNAQQGVMPEDSGKMAANLGGFMKNLGDGGKRPTKWDWFWFGLLAANTGSLLFHIFTGSWIMAAVNVAGVAASLVLSYRIWGPMASDLEQTVREMEWFNPLVKAKKMIRSESASERERGAQLLGQLKSEESWNILIDRLYSEKDVSVAQAILDTFGAADPVVATRACSTALLNDDREIRFKALWRLAKIDSPDARRLLVSKVGSLDSRDAAEAVSLCVKLGERSCIPEFLHQLETTTDTDFSILCAKGLQSLGEEKQAVGILMSKLASGRFHFESEIAAKTLAAMGVTDVLPALYAAYEKADKQNGKTIKEAIARYPKGKRVKAFLDCNRGKSVELTCLMDQTSLTQEEAAEWVSKFSYNESGYWIKVYREGIVVETAAASSDPNVGEYLRRVLAKELRGIDTRERSLTFSFSSIGASLDAKDYTMAPLPYEKIDPGLTKNAQKAFSSNFRQAAERTFLHRDFAGFYWAKFMPSAALITKEDRQFGFLLDEKLKEVLTGSRHPARDRFLYLLMLHEGQEFSLKKNSNGNMKAEVRAELDTMRVFAGMSDDDQKEVLALCRKIEESAYYYGRLVSVFTFYKQLSRKNLSDDENEKEIAKFYRKYPPFIIMRGEEKPMATQEPQEKEVNRFDGGNPLSSGDIKGIEKGLSNDGGEFISYGGAKVPIIIGKAEGWAFEDALRMLSRRYPAFGQILDSGFFMGFFWASYMTRPVAHSRIDKEFALFIDESLKGLPEEQTGGMRDLLYLLSAGELAELFRTAVGKPAAQDFPGHLTTDAYTKFSESERERLEKLCAGIDGRQNAYSAVAIKKDIEARVSGGIETAKLVEDLKAETLGEEVQDKLVESFEDSKPKTSHWNVRGEMVRHINMIRHKNGIERERHSYDIAGSLEALEGRRLLSEDQIIDLLGLKSGNFLSDELFDLLKHCLIAQGSASSSRETVRIAARYFAVMDSQKGYLTAAEIEEFGQRTTEEGTHIFLLDPNFTLQLDGGLRVTLFGTQEGTIDKEHMPLISSEAGAEVKEAAMEMLKKRIPEIADAYADGRFAGFFWASYMSWPSVVSEQGGEWAIFFDERLKGPLAADPKQSALFLFMVLARHAVDLMFEYRKIGYDINTASCAELTAADAYSKLTHHEALDLFALMKRIDDAKIYKVSFWEHIRKYDEVIRCRVGGEAALPVMADFIKQYPVPGTAGFDPKQASEMSRALTVPVDGQQAKPDTNGKKPVYLGQILRVEDGRRYFSKTVGRINHGAINKNGTILAFAGQFGGRLLKPSSIADEEIFLREYTEELNKIEFRPDGKMIAGLRRGSRLAVWDLSGNLLYLSSEEEPLADFIFSSDSRYLITINTAKKIAVRVADNFKVLANPTGSYEKIIPYPSGGCVVYDYWERIAFFNLPHGAYSNEFDSPNRRLIDNSRPTPSGKRIPLEVSSNSIELVDFDGISDVRPRFYSHRGKVLSVDFSPDGSKALSADSSKVYIWDTENGNKLQERNFEDIRLAFFDPSGRAFYVVLKDKIERREIVYVGDGMTVGGQWGIVAEFNMQGLAFADPAPARDLLVQVIEALATVLASTGCRAPPSWKLYVVESPVPARISVFRQNDALALYLTPVFFKQPLKEQIELLYEGILSLEDIEGPAADEKLAEFKLKRESIQDFPCLVPILRDELCYPGKTLFPLEARFRSLFTKIDLAAFKAVFEKARGHEEISAGLLMLMRALISTGAIEHASANTFNLLLLSIIDDAEVARLLEDEGSRPREYLEQVYNCTVISQLAHVVLRCVGLNAVCAASDAHAFNLVVLKDRELIADFTIRRILEIQPRTYRQSGVDRVLNDDLRISRERLAEIRKELEGNKVTISSAEELLNAFYYYIHVCLPPYGHSSSILNNIGITLFKRGDKLSAFSCLEKAFAFDPAYVHTFTNAAAVLSSLGRPAEAEELCAKAAELNGVDVAVWTNRVNALLQLDRLEEALQALEKAAELAPESAVISKNLGDLYYTMRLPYKAVLSYRKAIRVDPSVIDRVPPHLRRACEPAADGGFYPLFGTSLKAEELAREPITCGPVVIDLLLPAMMRLMKFDPAIYSVLSTRSCAGFYWAQYMPASLAVRGEHNEYGVLFDERLQDYLEAARKETVEIFLFLLLVYGSSWLYLGQFEVSGGINAAVAVESMVLEAYGAVGVADRESLQKFCRILENDPQYNGRFLPVLQAYEGLLRAPEESRQLKLKEMVLARNGDIKDSSFHPSVSDNLKGLLQQKNQAASAANGAVPAAAVQSSGPTWVHMVSQMWSAFGCRYASLSPDGRLLLKLYNNAVDVCETDSGTLKKRLEFNASIEDACFADEDRKIAIATASGVGIWDTRTFERLANLNKDRVHGIAAGGKGRNSRIIFRKVYQPAFFDAGTHTLLGNLQDPDGWCEHTAVTPDGKLALSENTNRVMRLWDLSRNRVIASSKSLSMEGTVGTAFDPAGNILMTVSADKTVRLWDARKLEPLAALVKSEEEIVGYGFNRDGTRAYTVYKSGKARIWSVPEGTLVDELSFGHPVEAFLISPDFSRIITQMIRDDLVLSARVWEVRSGAPQKEECQPIKVTTEKSGKRTLVQRFLGREVPVSVEVQEFQDNSPEFLLKFSQTLQLDGGCRPVVRWSILGASREPGDYLRLPLISSSIDNGVTGRVRGMVKASFPVLYRVLTRDDFQGLYWAKYMHSASAMVDVNGDKAILFDERMRAIYERTGPQDALAAFMYLLVVHESSEIFASIEGMPAGRASEVFAELNVLAAYKGLNDEERDGVRRLCALFEQEDGLRGRFLDVVDFYARASISAAPLAEVEKFIAGYPSSPSNDDRKDGGTVYSLLGASIDPVQYHRHPLAVRPVFGEL
ncbi:MAG: type II CAAX prenyl endopeptidase Rce1 family protein, partial [Deltaproteobacteria bacterium]